VLGNLKKKAEYLYTALLNHKLLILILFDGEKFISQQIGSAFRVSDFLTEQLVLHESAISNDEMRNGTDCS
jgi:hypothetical protein